MRANNGAETNCREARKRRISRNSIPEWRDASKSSRSFCKLTVKATLSSSFSVRIRKDEFTLGQIQFQEGIFSARIVE